MDFKLPPFKPSRFSVITLHPDGRAVASPRPNHIYVIPDGYGAKELYLGGTYYALYCDAPGKAENEFAGRVLGTWRDKPKFYGPVYLVQRNTWYFLDPFEELERVGREELVSPVQGLTQRDVEIIRGALARKDVGLEEE